MTIAGAHWDVSSRPQWSVHLLWHSHRLLLPSTRSSIWGNRSPFFPIFRSLFAVLLSSQVQNVLVRASTESSLIHFVCSTIAFPLSPFSYCLPIWIPALLVAYINDLLSLLSFPFVFHVSRFCAKSAIRHGPPIEIPLISLCGALFCIREIHGVESFDSFSQCSAKITPSHCLKKCMTKWAYNLDAMKMDANFVLRVRVSMFLALKMAVERERLRAVSFSIFLRFSSRPLCFSFPWREKMESPFRTREKERKRVEVFHERRNLTKEVPRESLRLKKERHDDKQEKTGRWTIFDAISGRTFVPFRGQSNINWCKQV